MGAVSVENFDVGPERDVVPEHPDGLPFLDYATPKRVFGLKSNYKDGVPGVGRSMQEMMDDPARLGHARCRNHHKRSP